MADTPTPADPIGPYVADVAVATGQVVAGRLELLRAQIKEDVRRILAAVAFGVLAVFVAGVGVVSLVAAGIWALAPLVGWAGAAGIVAAVSFGLGGGAAMVARARLAPGDPPPHALGPGDSTNQP